MAAGRATRMGRDKLALPWRGSTVFAEVLQTVLQAVELVGYSWQQLRPQVELVVVARQPLAVYAPGPLQQRFHELGGIWWQGNEPQPLAKTIQIGLQNLKAETIGIGFLPADQVGIEHTPLADLINYFLRIGPDFLVPFAGDVSGSPVIFHRKYVQELLDLTGEQGGKTILARYRDRWRTYPVHTGFFADLDTPEDYSRLRKLT